MAATIIAAFSSVDFEEMWGGNADGVSGQVLEEEFLRMLNEFLDGLSSSQLEALLRRFHLRVHDLGISDDYR